MKQRSHVEVSQHNHNALLRKKIKAEQLTPKDSRRSDVKTLLHQSFVDVVCLIPEV